MRKILEKVISDEIDSESMCLSNAEVIGQRVFLRYLADEYKINWGQNENE